MGRHPENAGNLIDLEFPRFQKLRLLRGNADGLIFQALLQNCDLMGICTAAKELVPAFPHFIRVFQYAGMFQHTAGGSIVGEKLRTVFLAGNRHSHRVLCHGDGRIAHDPVIAEAGNMKHLLRRQINLPVFIIHRGIVRATGIEVINLSLAVPVNGHLGGHQRIEADHLALAIADDLRVSVPV